MKQYLQILGLVIIVSGIFTSCKPDTLTALHEYEVSDRDQFIKAKGLAEYKDVSGLYFKDSIIGTGDTIKSGYLVKMYLKVSLLDGTLVSTLTTEDKYGNNYEAYSFFVDVSNDIVNERAWQQIAGLHKGFKKMRIGGIANLVIPSELAFQALDKTAALGIPRFSTLVVTVHAVKGYSPEQQKEQQQY